MVAVNTSGSQTATLTTEHTLATVASAKVLQSTIDVANLANDETLTIRLYGKARSGDTERLQDSWTIRGSTIKKLFTTPAFVSPHHYKLTIEQNGGTGRAFPWAIYEV